jgi:hypothetical protein
MFTTPCFIKKNTSELRDYLKKIGYKSGLSFTNSDVLVVNENKYSQVDSFLVDNREFKIVHVDCSDNENVFKAIAALRNDKNDYQWFVWDDESEADTENDRWRLFEDIPEFGWMQFEIHKATVDEIIEHFK